jgi:hypothetical protein
VVRERVSVLHCTYIACLVMEICCDFYYQYTQGSNNLGVWKAVLFVRGFVMTFSVLNTVDCHLSAFNCLDKGSKKSSLPPLALAR